MNIGYEDDELKPYIEPHRDYNDPVRIGKIVRQDYHCYSGTVLWCMYL